jgi:hypothetical protein
VSRLSVNHLPQRHHTDLHRNTIHLQIHHRRVAALVDTGACISVVSQKFLDRLPPFISSTATPSTKPVFTASGERLAIHSKIGLTLNISGLLLSHDFFVTDHLSGNYQLILGLDFLEKFQCSIDLPGRSITFCDQLMALPLHAGTLDPKFMATTKHKVRLPPWTESLVPLAVHPSYSSSSVLCLSPSPAFPNKRFLLPRAVVTPHHSQVTVRIINLSHVPIILRPGMVIANVHSVYAKDISRFDDGNGEGLSHVNSIHTTAGSRPNPTRITEEDIEIALKQLDVSLEEADLNTAQKQQLARLIVANRSVFSTGLHDLGRIHGFEHTIDTGDSRPIRKRHYRMTKEQRLEIEKQVEEMLQNDIIEPSVSEWVSPVVLVKKADGVNWRFCC